MESLHYFWFLGAWLCTLALCTAAVVITNCVLSHRAEMAAKDRELERERMNTTSQE